MPLGDASILYFTSPIYVRVFARIFLKEPWDCFTLHQHKWARFCKNKILESFDPQCLFVGACVVYLGNWYTHVWIGSWDID